MIANKEQAFLLKVYIKEEEQTEQGRMRAILDAQFVNDCLEVQRMQSFNRIGTRKSGYNAMLETYENLLMQRINADYEMGINKKTAINISDIESVIYEFTFKYIKLKGTEGKYRKFKDTQEILAENLELATLALHRRLKKLKETMVETISTTKSISMIYCKDGNSYNEYQVEILTT